MKRNTIVIIISMALIAIIVAPLSYAWFSISLKKNPQIESYVHKSYFESGDGMGVYQYNTSYTTDGEGHETAIHGVDGEGNTLSSETGCAFEIKYPVQLYYFAWLQALGYFNVSSDGDTAIEQVYFYLSADLDMTGWVLPQIGTATYPFVGNFDGNGHTISNLTVQNVEGTAPNIWTDKPADISPVNGTTTGGTGSTPTAGYTYEKAVNEIKNLALTNITIKRKFFKFWD